MGKLDKLDKLDADKLRDVVKNYIVKKRLI